MMEVLLRYPLKKQETGELFMHKLQPQRFPFKKISSAAFTFVSKLMALNCAVTALIEIMNLIPVFPRDPQGTTVGVWTACRRVAHITIGVAYTDGTR